MRISDWSSDVCSSDLRSPIYPMLHINDLEFRIQGDPLFDRATVAVNKGERVGLVGRNGAGKTTLLKLISGELHPDGGSIAYPRTTRVGKVAQEAPSGQTSLIATVLEIGRASWRDRVCQ